MRSARSLLAVARPVALLGAAVALASAPAACTTDECAFSEGPPSAGLTLHTAANACVTITTVSRGAATLSRASDGAHFELRGCSTGPAARFHLRATDLGTYLLRDADGGYLTDDAGGLGRAKVLESDTSRNEDGYVSPAEWHLEVSPVNGARFRLKNRASGAYLAAAGLTRAPAEAADVVLSKSEGCSDFPELSIDATGEVSKTRFSDGTLYGVVDAHSHLFSNFGFGGGGTFHGSPFHRLGVEHALPDCAPFHGDEGRSDVLGYFYNGDVFDIGKATSALFSGRVPEFDHYTAGYPKFTSWPRAVKNSTHQTQYYRWVERAYLGGLRLLVQHATSNQVLCELMNGIRAQQKRLSCNEMESAEREIDETYALERYVDAQAGGPGRGWFRVVTSPAKAREVIAQGKLAVVLGIETSNLFDCFLTPRPGYPACDAAAVRAKLDHIHARGVRVLFPVHKFDNAFSAGDGHRGFIEIGSFLNTGHYSNFTKDCDPNSDARFDHGDVMFGGINRPREAYDGPAPLNLSGFEKAPVATMLPYVDDLKKPALKGEYCQNAGLTPLGEVLITEMMRRGMILEIDHFPKRSYARAVELLVKNDYPAAGTHGSTAKRQLYALGGISTLGVPRCSDGDPAAFSAAFEARFDAIAASGGYRAQGFGFDLNGLAGAPGPRFGALARCSKPQTRPVTYPFKSFAGDVTLTPPTLGERTVDFNSEGMVHIGLMPELVEDARRMGVTDAALEPLFRSAEGYVRMWERAESRGAALSATRAP
ncbi:MAG TPA: hypothetical protein PLR99_00840 [Polyangiaceae bacterium]|nr:hypothetical protein [Polyangiaceae bacterium]